MDDATDSTVWWLKHLDGSLKWEGRFLVSVLLGPLLILINYTVGRIFLGLGTFVVIIMVRV